MRIHASVKPVSYKNPDGTTRRMLLFSFRNSSGAQVGRAEVDLERPGAIINWMEVYPLFQNQGIGVIQTSLIHSELRRRGIPAVGLVAGRKLAQFWKKQGFQKTPESAEKYHPRYEFIKRLIG